MPKLVSSRIIAASHYPYEPPEALKKYLSTGGTIQALTRRIMARPMIETAEMLQAEFEEGMDAHSYTPPGKPVVPRDWGYTKMGGFLHPSYSRDVLIPSKACFHRVVKCAGILDSPAWLAKRPLPTEMTTAEAHELRLYYKQVIDEFEELMEDELSWVKELNPEWIAAIEARVTGPITTKAKLENTKEGEQEAMKGKPLNGEPDAATWYMAAFQPGYKCKCRACERARARTAKTVTD